MRERDDVPTKFSLNCRAPICWALILGLLPGFVFSGLVQAEDGAVHSRDQKVSVGTRRPDRTVKDSIAPVDVIHAQEFLTLGYTDLPQIIAKLAPSYTFPMPSIVNGTEHARPSSLRGMAPDQMLVLLNGKRRNPSAQFHRADTLGRDSLGVDLSVIPIAAVKRIEILRDGASAIYGTDAIAGVINIVLKDAKEGGSLTGTFGQYRTTLKGVPKLSDFERISDSEFGLFERAEIAVDDGDGDIVTFSVHGAFTLFEDGFLNLGFDYFDQDTTNRSGYDPRAFYPPLPNGDFDPREQFVDRRTHAYGNPEQTDYKMLVNFGLPVSERVEFYGYIGYTSRNADSRDLYRLPVDDATITEVYPDGYLPELQSDVEDRYFSLGFRGTHWGWDWDFSMDQGENEIDWELGSSINASIGPSSPTRFTVANYEGRHQMFNLDLFRYVDVGFIDRPLALATGLEYRSAEYENERGDQASNFLGRYLTDDGGFRPSGSQGFYGVRPQDDFDDSIDTVAAYVELDADLTDDLAVQLALRVDDNDENTDVTAKLATRWNLSERWTLRGSVSQNIHSPSPAQAYFWATERDYLDSGAVQESGVYPADNPVALTLGADTLDSETALNLQAGVRFQATEALYFELDLYQIEVDDQIVMTEALSGPAVEGILADAGITGIGPVQYLYNGLDMRTRGADFSTGYNWSSPWGPIAFSAGLNLTDRSVTSRASLPPELVTLGTGFELVPSAWQNQLEDWAPDSKLHLQARWQRERYSLDLRVQRYGKVTDYGDTPADDLDLDGTWLVDLNAQYALTDSMTAGLGIQNLLDEYPDVPPRDIPDKPYNNILPYSNYSPYGFNGRFAYLRLTLDFATD